MQKFVVWLMGRGCRLWAVLRLLCPRLWRRIDEDQLTVSAGYLAYVTLLSLVPLIAVVFGVLSAFPVFADGRGALEQFLFENLVPAASDAIREHLLAFAENTKRMTAMGAVFLFAAALLLISNIDRTLNNIWRVPQRRSFLASFPVYWMVLTLGPLLVGSSIVVTSYVVSWRISGDEMLSSIYLQLLRGLPFVLSVAAFFILYTVVPNVRVRPQNAMLGALLAALLFEASKKVFAFYVTKFPSYEAIYGALAAIPILFLWVYLCWLIVLIGALFTATLDEVAPRAPQHYALTKETLTQDKTS